MRDLHHLTGVGLASVESVGAAALAAAAGATFNAAFTLDAPHDYRFSGTGTVGGFAFLTGYDPNFGFTGYYFTHFFDGSGVFENSRRLGTGTYLLEVATGAGSSSWPSTTRVSSSYDFTFDLQASPTPEPGSMLLVGSGLVGLAGVVGRRIRANRP
jgi:hypothetical protein